MRADCVCQGWNPWHHPYTAHAAWCPAYADEPADARARNTAYGAAGGFYAVGYPADGRPLGRGRAR